MADNTNISEAGRQPHVLISTVSGWSNSVGSDTMSTLFSKYDPDKLASLYIRAEKSDSPVCHRYFHIFESKVIKSIFKRSLPTGEEYSVTDNSGMSETAEYEKEKKFYAKFTNFRPWTLILARELVWKLGRWKTRELDAFLDDFKPEVLVFPIESYIHLNRINEYIISRCKPRLVACILWDDNFTFKQSKSPGFFLHRIWLRRHFRKLVAAGNVFISQSPKMQREFKEVFGKDSVLLTKPIFNLGEFGPYSPHSPIKILYTGNLYINRDKSVIALANAIKKINEGGRKIELEVYSGSRLSGKQKAAIESADGCRFCGHINQSEVFVKQREADVLLFAEDLSDRHLAARLSFSTKITDYFRAGKCILAIGNKDLSPIEYLKEQDAAVVCTKENEILPALKEMVGNDALIPQYARNAYECGKRNHDGEAIIQKLYGIICSEKMKVKSGKLEHSISELLFSNGMDKFCSDAAARCMVLADLNGISSHGTAILPSHFKRMMEGGYNLKPEFKTVSESPSFAVIDSDNAIGFASASYCMDYAIDKAKTNGIFTVWGRNANAYGAASCYTIQAARQGLVGISCCNSPSAMAPVGGKDKMLGTNPISIAIPTSGEPIIIDMATSKVAKSKFLQAKKEGKPLGEGWALDKEGRPTTDPDEGIQGLVCPMEGFKGYGLALGIDFLAGLLSGSACLDGVNRFYDEKYRPMDVGHFFTAINPSVILGDNYQALIRSYIDSIRQSARVNPDIPIAIPGDDMHRKYEKNISQGIEISPEVAVLLGLRND